MNAWSVSMTGSTLDPGETDDHLTRLVLLLGDDVGSSASLFYAGVHRLAQNMTLVYDSGQGIYRWEYEVSSGGAEGTFTLAPRTLSFDDQAMDVTGWLELDTDGRFNQADVAALQTLVGTTDPAAIERWNLAQEPNQPEIIDAADVAYLQGLVDLQLDSGVFGDLNDDGLPDCQWRDEIAMMFGYVLGDPAYRVQLDYDLDGDTDSVDSTRFLEYTCPWPLGDTNCDGLVDFGDINPFVDAVLGQERYTAEYPSCVWLNGDMSCDGAVNFGDINPFVDCLVHGLCGCP